MSVVVEAITGTAVGLVMLVVGLLIVVRHATAASEGVTATSESTDSSKGVADVQKRASGSSGNELQQPLLVENIP